MRAFVSVLIAVSLLAACENASQQKPITSPDAQTVSCQCTEGKQGQHGETGKTGPQGKPGEKSNDGSPGPKGDKGDVGPQGPQGVAGLQGPMGTAGAQGLPGSDGTSCVAQSAPEGVLVVCGNEKVLVKHGDIGPQGIAGVPGPIGEKGADGLQGPVGPKGEIGPQGIKGDQGAQGLVGKDGTSGPKGDTGPQGPKGDMGVPGFNLKIIDSKGKYVGHVLDVDLSHPGNSDTHPTWKVYNKELKLAFYVSSSLKVLMTEAQSNSIYFTNTDCTGQAYMHVNAYPLALRGHPGAYYRAKMGAQVTMFLGKSRIESPDFGVWVCTVGEQSPQSHIPVEPVSIDFLGPFEVVE